MRFRHEMSNPWLSMWTSPRATMRVILDRDVDHLIHLIALLGAFDGILSGMATKGLGDTLSVPWMMWMAFFFSFPLMFWNLYGFGGLIWISGKWFGGRATYRELRAVVAWSLIPIVWGLVAWVSVAMYIGREYFKSTPMVDNDATIYLIRGAGLVELGIALWYVIVFLQCLREAQQFSLWKAIANLCVAISLIVGPIAAIAWGWGK